TRSAASVRAIARTRSRIMRRESRGSARTGADEGAESVPAMRRILRRFGRRRFFLRRDRVLLGGPLAEIDHLAALAAERAPRIGLIERRALAAARAGRAARLRGHYRTQHWSWNGMSCEDCRLRALTSLSAMKRMVKRWRPALISGYTW